MRTPRAILVLCLALGLGFAWGFLAHREGVFPYDHLRALAGLPEEGTASPTPGQPDPAEVAAALDMTTLPYVAGTYDPDAHLRGVTVHDAERVEPGLNLYSSGSTAYLMDNDGGVVHSWEEPEGREWQHVELLGDGRLVGSVNGREIMLLSLTGRPLWRTPLEAHHDFWVGRDRVLAATLHGKVVPRIHPSHPTLDESLTELSLQDGSVLGRISLLDVVLESPYAFLLPSFADEEIDRDSEAIDALHHNHVEMLDGSLAHASPILAAGNLLVSFRNINSVMILAAGTYEPLWVWGPSNLVLPHHPSLVAPGHVLVFDNGVEQSEVLEVDPANGAVVWSWTDEDFFSQTRGSVQRLPGGNTLVTESDAGYVYEVAPEGQIVWEFANPDVGENDVRTVIWRMVRLDPTWLEFLPDSP